LKTILKYAAILSLLLVLLGAAYAQQSESTAMASAAGAFVLIWFVLIGAILLFVLVSFIAFIWAIIDILKAKNETNWKILWVIICLFLGLIGVIIYYFVGRKQKM